jgi:pimeloyl-ACP methyl ester carboxylesterase
VFENQYKEFTNDYHILAINLPGSHDDLIHKNEEYELGYLSLQIEKLILEKTAAKKNKEIIFIGHDLGCFILDLVASRLKIKVSAQIHISGMGLELYAARSGSIRQWFKSAYILFLHIPGAPFAIKKFLKKYVAALVYGISGINKNSTLYNEAPYGFNPIRIYLNLSRQCRKLLLRTSKRQSSVPTLFIFGKEEKFLNLPTESEVKRFYSHGQKILLNGGHWLLKDRYVEVNAAIRNFITFKQMSFYEN